MSDLRDISTVVTKTGGIILVFYAVSLFPSHYVSAMFDRETSTSLRFFGVLAGTLVPFAVGSFLYLWPATIANRVVSVSDSDAASLGLGRLVSAGIGLFFVVKALTDLLYWGLYYYSLREHPAARAISGENFYIWATLIELVLGVFLMFGRDRIGRLMYETRKSSAP